MVHNVVFYWFIIPIMVNHGDYLMVILGKDEVNMVDHHTATAKKTIHHINNDNTS